MTKLPQFVLLKEVGLMKDYRATVPINHRLEYDAVAFLKAMTPSITVLIEKELNQLGGLKFTLDLVAVLEKSVCSLEQVYDDIIITTCYFRSKAMSILNQGDIAHNLNEAKAEALGHLEKFLKEGSGWRLKRCETVDLGMVQYRPFRGRRATSRRRHTFHRGLS